MKEIPLKVDTNAAAAAEELRLLTKNLGLTEKELINLTRAMKQQQSETAGMLGKFEKLTSTLGTLASAAKNVGTAFGIGMSFKTLEAATLKYNNTLFTLSRNTKVFGGNYADMSKATETLSKTTLMSTQASADFAAELQRNVRGVRLTGAEVTKLGQVLTSEYGGSIDDINKATKDLIDLQQKNINLFKELADTSSMSDEAFQDYLYTMEDVFDASKDQINSLIKTRNAYKENGQQLSEQEKGLRALADSHYGLQKAVQDTETSVGQQFANEFEKLNNFMRDSVKWVGNLTERFPGLTKAIGFTTAGIAGLAASTGIFRAGKGILSLFGGKAPGGAKAPSGIVDTVKDLAGIGAGQLGTASNPMYVRLAGGGMLEEIAGKTEAVGNKGGIYPAVGSGGASNGLLSKLGGKLTLGNIFAGLSLGAAAYGGATTAFSDEKYNENVKGRTQVRAMDVISTAFSPDKWGKDIVSAIRLGWDAVAASIETIGGTKEVQAAAKMSNKEFTRHIVETGATSTEAKVANIGQAGKATTDLAKERSEREAAIAHLQMEKHLSELIVGSLETQIEYEMKFGNAIENVSGMQGRMKDSLLLQLASAEKILALSNKNKQAALTKIAADEKAAEAIDNEEQRTERLLQLTEKREAIEARELRQTGEIAKLKANISKLELDVNKKYEAREQTLDSQLSLAEAEYQQSQLLFAGMGPTIEAQRNIVGLLEQKIDIAEKEIRNVEALRGQYKSAEAYQQALASAQKKKVDLVSKELEITKNLREGYLDAMSAFTNVEGSFSKIIQRKESGFGEVMRQFGAPAATRAGGLGAGGAQESLFKFESGTGRAMLGSNAAFNQLHQAFGLDTTGGDMLSRRNQIQAAATAKGAGLEEAVMAGAGPAAGGGGASGAARANEDAVNNIAAGIKKSGVIGDVREGSKKSSEAAKVLQNSFGPTAKSPGNAMDMRTDAARASNKQQQKSFEEYLARNRVGGRDVTNGIFGGKANVPGMTPVTKALEGGVMPTKPTKEAELKRQLEIEKGKRPAGHADTMTAKEKEIQKELKQIKLNTGGAKDTLKDLSKKADVSKQETENAFGSPSMLAGGLNAGLNMFGIQGGGPLGLDLGDSPAFQNWSFSGGGTVPGAGSSDTVPAMLTPGERIIRKDASRKFGPFLDALNRNHYAMGGVAGSSPGVALSGIGGGGSPRISLSVKGDSVNKIMKSVNSQLGTQLNRMMAPSGTTGRYFDIAQYQ